MDLRDLSCLLLCSLRLNARLQYWHLYFFSGTPADFFTGAGAAEAVAGITTGREHTRSLTACL